jgi:hypothetical protein
MIFTIRKKSRQTFQNKFRVKIKVKENSNHYKQLK